MQQLLDEVEFSAIKKLVASIAELKTTKIRFIKFDYEKKQVIVTDGHILVVLTDRMPNDLARQQLGIKEDLLIPLSQIKSFKGLGKVEIKTLYDLSVTNPKTKKVVKKPVPILTAYDLDGAEYSTILDFVTGENEYVDYEEMLTKSNTARQNALFGDELPEYGVTRLLPRMEEGLRKMDEKANLSITKDFIVSEGFVDHWSYRVIARTPKKHDVGNLAS